MIPSSDPYILSEGRRIFVDLIEDILQSAEDLRYHSLIGRKAIAAGRVYEEEEVEDGTYVVLVGGVLYRCDESTDEIDAVYEPDDDEGKYAVFIIETNPTYELAVSIELAEGEFRICINDSVLVKKMTGADMKRPEKWIEKRCRDVDRLVAGDMKLEIDTFFGRTVSTLLIVGKDDKWREIADRDDGWGWLGLVSLILPFGLSMVRSEETFYQNWFAAPGHHGPRE